MFSNNYDIIYYIIWILSLYILDSDILFLILFYLLFLYLFYFNLIFFILGKWKGIWVQSHDMLYDMLLPGM